LSFMLRRNSLPELEGLNRDQTRNVWRKAYLRAFAEPFAWIGILNFIVIAMLGNGVAGPMGMLIGAVIGAIVWMQFHLRAAKPWCRHYRQELGYPPPPNDPPAAD